MTEPALPNGQRPRQSTVPIGTVINNNYVVTELLSIGGMGEVFRGENTFTGDPVAIKIVLQDLAQDANIATLFRREAKVLCGLSHPAVVRYFNFVRDDALDRFCLIMEYVDGTVLSDHIRDQSPLSVEQAMTLMRRLAKGLAEVHAMDVIHRDLSPDNVIMRGDDIDQSVLIDFGISKSTQMTDKTLHGQLAGKLKFISPEQLGHFEGTISPRTDIYGLALLIAYAVQGHAVPMGETVAEAVNLRRAIPNLRHFDPRLRAVLAHMLEPDPADRPSDMAHVLTLLDDSAQLPEKYRPLGPKVTAREADDRAIAAVFEPPKVIPVAPAPVAPTQQKGAAVWRWPLAIAAIGGATWFITQQTTAPVETDRPVVTETATGPVTRGQFLATYADGCGFAARISGGPKAGTIATFAEDSTLFTDLATDYDAAFDAAPVIAPSEVTTAQCPGLALARSLASSGSASPLLDIDSTTLPPDGTIVGRLSNRRGQPVWLALITAEGGVYNLTDRLVEQPEGGATFSLGLESDGLTDPQPQLLIALATDAPLIAAAAAGQGADAATLLPLIEAEIAGRDGQAGVALSQFLLLP